MAMEVVIEGLHPRLQSPHHMFLPHDQPLLLVPVWFRVPARTLLVFRRVTLLPMLMVHRATLTPIWARNLGVQMTE